MNNLWRIAKTPSKTSTKAIKPIINQNLVNNNDLRLIISMNIKEENINSKITTNNFNRTMTMKSQICLRLISDSFKRHLILTWEMASLRINIRGLRIYLKRYLVIINLIQAIATIIKKNRKQKGNLKQNKEIKQKKRKTNLNKMLSNNNIIINSNNKRK